MLPLSTQQLFIEYPFDYCAGAATFHLLSSTCFFLHALHDTHMRPTHDFRHKCARGRAHTQRNVHAAQPLESDQTFKQLAAAACCWARFQVHQQLALRTLLACAHGATQGPPSLPLSAQCLRLRPSCATAGWWPAQGSLQARRRLGAAGWARRAQRQCCAALCKPPAMQAGCLEPRGAPSNAPGLGTSVGLSSGVPGDALGPT